MPIIRLGGDAFPWCAFGRATAGLLLGLASVQVAACGSKATKDSSAAATDCVPPKSIDACPEPVPSFQAEIAPILNERCNNCHAPGLDGGPWPLDNWQDVDDWAPLVVKVLEQCSMPPPDTGAPFPAAERDKLWAWLACGAPNN